MKIAIYAGCVPTSSFIEALIDGVSRTHKVYLFGSNVGVCRKYSNVIVSTFGVSRARKLIYLFGLLFKFVLRRPGGIPIIIRCARTARSANDLLRILPFLLYKPDIVHIQWAKAIGFALWVRRFTDFHLIVSLRGAHINYSPLADADLAMLYREAFPFVDAFHAVSKAVAREAANYGADAEKVTVIYSGVADHLLDHATSRKSGDDLEFESTWELVSIGRHHWKKGFQYALDALSRVKGTGLKFSYSIVGDGDSEEINYLIKDLDLVNEVALTPGVPHHRVYDILRTKHILLLPSVEEGIANVVLEAMAMGVLVISSDCGGMRELIEDGHNGFLVPTRGSSAMATRIEDAARMSVDERRKIRERAYRTVFERHRLSQTVQSMNRLYDRVMRGTKN